MKNWILSLWILLPAIAQSEQVRLNQKSERNVAIALKDEKPGTLLVLRKDGDIEKTAKLFENFSNDFDAALKEKDKGLAMEKLLSGPKPTELIGKCENPQPVKDLNCVICTNGKVVCASAPKGK